MAWARLYEMLPDRRYVVDGWEPAPPLILSAWDTPGLFKLVRLEEHLEWAYTHGCLDQVDAYLRGLQESDWHHVGDW